MAKVANAKRPTFRQTSRAASAKSKASWHAVEGTGRRRVIRNFFELDDKDMAALTDYLQGRLEQRIAKQA